LLVPAKAYLLSCQREIHSWISRDTIKTYIFEEDALGCPEDRIA
jgi:hypothetical protein